MRTGFCTVTLKLGDSQLCPAPNPSVNWTWAAIVFDPSGHWDVSPLAVKVPLPAGVSALPMQSTNTCVMVLKSENPLVGVNTNEVVPESVFPGCGLESTPGMRASTNVWNVASPVP